jgi:hypothetical protein
MHDLASAAIKNIEARSDENIEAWATELASSIFPNDFTMP